MPGQSRPVRTIPEEPQEAHDAGSASEGDADDEGAGPSRPAQGPRFKQGTICFASAAMWRPMAAQAVPPAPAVVNLGKGLDAGGGTAVPAATEVEDSAACGAPAAAAPAKRRRRKRRAAQQQVSDASVEDARDPDREADAPRVSQPKLDPRQRTMAASFASARARSATASGVAARILAGAEGSQANPVDLSEPSPQAVDPMAAAAEASAMAPDGVTNAPEDAAAGAGPKKRQRRKRRKAEQPELGSTVEALGEQPASGAAQPQTGPRQRTLTLSFTAVALPPVPEAGLVADAVCAGTGAAEQAPESNSVLDADATFEADPVAAVLGPAAGKAPAAEKPKKRAYRKRIKAAAEACQADAGDAHEVQVVAPQPQVLPDPKQRKLSFAAARPQASADVASPVPANPAAQDAGSLGQPSDAQTAARTEGSPPLLCPGASAGGVSRPGGNASPQPRGCAEQVRAFTRQALAFRLGKLLRGHCCQQLCYFRRTPLQPRARHVQCRGAEPGRGSRQGGETRCRRDGGRHR